MRAIVTNLIAQDTFSSRRHAHVIYLGNVLACDMCDAADIRVKKGEFIGSVNRLNVQFHVVPNDIRIRLLQTYCTSWYGCQTWLLNTNAVKGLNTEWKKAVRYTLHLSRMTISYWHNIPIFILLYILFLQNIMFSLLLHCSR